MSNINDTYFDGYYKDIWRNIIPEILTEREIAFILSYFSLKPGDKILDLMSGYGRHTLRLAEKGMKVTAIDNLPAYTKEIEEKAKEKNLDVKVITGDVINSRLDDKFDLVICMGNNLNFFDPPDLKKLVSNVSAHISPGGYFLINTWAIAEIALQNFKEKSQQGMGGFEFITENKLLEDPKRIEMLTTMIPPEGKPETKSAIDYIYSLDELNELFKQCGLSTVEVFSIPGKKKFAKGEPRAYIVAKKV